MKTTIRFEGGAELAKALESLSARVSKKVTLEVLRESAEPMRKRMGQLAPRSDDPPHAADTMTISNSRGQDAQEAAVAVGATKQGFYLSFSEFGAVHHAAQPWARPAFDTEASGALSSMAAAFWRELAGRGISRTISAPSGVIGGPGGSLE